MEDLEVEKIDANIVSDIDINYAKHHEIMPTIETDYSVTVAITDPFNFSAINDMQNIFKKEVKIVVTSPLKINDAINRVFERSNKNLLEDIEDEFEENLDLVL